MTPDPCWNTEDDVRVVKVAYMVLNALLKPACTLSEPAANSEASFSDMEI